MFTFFSTVTIPEKKDCCWVSSASIIWERRQTSLQQISLKQGKSDRQMKMDKQHIKSEPKYKFLMLGWTVPLRYLQAQRNEQSCIFPSSEHRKINEAVLLATSSPIQYLRQVSRLCVDGSWWLLWFVAQRNKLFINCGPNALTNVPGILLRWSTQGWN